MAATRLARTVRVFADRTLSPAALSLHLATEARRLRDDLVATGQAPASWRTFVDGRESAAETTARRVIEYKFSLLTQAVGFALGYCIARSPVQSGRFRKSWFVAVNGLRWGSDLTAIPASAEVMVTNDQPYARKIDVGAMRMRVPPGIVEAARQAVQRAYPSIKAERSFLLLPSGYVLKRHGGRRDTRAGQALTYPALILSPR